MASFWFLPSLLLLLAMVAAFGLIYLDNQVQFKPEGVLQLLFSGSADSARTILSSIAGAMIGVAGTVFSITLVALTLASSQLGPRLLRNFMYDTLNQLVLGSYVATFVYCLLVLNVVSDNDGFTFVPAFSVLGAMLAAVVNIVLLIIFIHHVAISIQADKVVADISTALSSSVKKLFPDQIASSELEEHSDVDFWIGKKEYHQEFLAPRSGYLQSIDQHQLAALARDHDLLLVLKNRPGDFLVEGSALCEIHCREECPDELKEKIGHTFILGRIRTPLHDVEFAIHQMVEIALRALSPGVNDPYTAMTCIDNLSGVLSYLARAKFPDRCHYDEEEQLRIVTDHQTFEGMMDAAFNQIRQFSEGSPAVVIRLLEGLMHIYPFARGEARQAVVREHAQMVYHLAERTFKEERDLDDLKKRFAVFEGE